MRDALAPFRVLKVWIVPSKSLMVYWYLIVMVLPFVWFKQGGGIAPCWLLFLTLKIIIDLKIVGHIAMT